MVVRSEWTAPEDRIMNERKSSFPRIAGLIAMASVIGACSSEQPESGELQWARAALARNPQLEVVAVDRDAQVFTVRDKEGGTLHTVALADLVAGPAAMMVSHTRAAGGARDDDGRDAEQREPTRVVDEQRAAPTENTQVAGDEDALAADTSASEAVPEAESPVEAPAGAQPPAYTIERADGRVRVSGPGFSIMSAESSDQEIELAASAAAGDEPIVCEGRKMMHLDGRTLNVEGDAVIARNGCDLHITNSRIRATGVAVTATDAKVHITNSTLDGGLRSLELAEGGKAYLRSSTLDGLVQRFGATAELHDLGGNRWD